MFLLVRLVPISLDVPAEVIDVYSSFKIFVCLFVCFSFALYPCFCFADGSSSEVPETSSVTEYYYLDTSSLEDKVDELSSTVEELRDINKSQVVEGDLVEVNSQLFTVSASGSNGLKSLLLSLIGDYETVVTDYTYNNGSYTSHSISIERDWAWICSCCVFCAVLWCVFRGVVAICKR